MKYFSRIVVPFLVLFLGLSALFCRSHAFQLGEIQDRDSFVVGYCHYHFDLPNPRTYTFNRSYQHPHFMILPGQKNTFPYTPYGVEFVVEESDDWNKDDSNEDQFYRIVKTTGEAHEKNVFVQINYTKLMKTSLPRFFHWRYQGEYGDLTEPIAPGEIRCYFEKF